MVEWLKRRKLPEAREFEARHRHPTAGKLCQPSNKWVPSSNQGRIKQR